ncbi:hypothetical protein GWI34_05485 [Actinomadura sp. DSM 109109]|nr:hypothetical protein [Actinomadura lepetitiana]
MHRRHHANRSAHAPQTARTRAHGPVHRQYLNTSPPPKGGKTCSPHGPIRASGSGWQTADVLVLLTRVKIAFQAFPFAKVGDGSGYAAILRSNRDQSAAPGIELPQARCIRHDGAVEPLDSHLPREVALLLEDGKGEVISDSGWCTE